MNAQRGDVHLTTEVIRPLIGGQAKNNICSKDVGWIALRLCRLC